MDSFLIEPLKMWCQSPFSMLQMSGSFVSTTFSLWDIFHWKLVFSSQSETKALSFFHVRTVCPYRGCLWHRISMLLLINGNIAAHLYLGNSSCFNFCWKWTGCKYDTRSNEHEHTKQSCHLIELLRFEVKLQRWVPLNCNISCYLCCVYVGVNTERTDGACSVLVKSDVHFINFFVFCLHFLKAVLKILQPVRAGSSILPELNPFEGRYKE